MNFVVISDTHGQHRSLELPEGDVLIHAGDFCHYGKEAHLHDFLNWIDSLDYKHKLFIAGNHDFFADKYPQEFEKLIPESCTYLNDSAFECERFRFWGSPVSPDLVSFAFGRKRGEAIQKHWSLIPKNTDILITHTPLHGILDKSGRTSSLGCRLLLQKLQEIQPKAHIFGHIHASYDQVQYDDTLYINASSMHSKLGLVNPPVCFELAV